MALEDGMNPENTFEELVRIMLGAGHAEVYFSAFCHAPIRECRVGKKGRIEREGSFVITTSRTPSLSIHPSLQKLLPRASVTDEDGV